MFGSQLWKAIFSLERAPNIGAAFRKPVPGVLLAALPLLLITLWLWKVSQEGVQEAARARFEFRVSETLFAIQQRLLAYEQVLRGGISLFASSKKVTRDEWHTYVHNLDINTNYPGIQGLGFSRRILPTQRDAYIQAVRAEGFADYNLWPAGQRDEYTAIVYLEPFDWRNQRAFGYDMFSEPVRHEAMVRARDSGLPAVSGKVTLVQETGQEVQHGFLMYLPLYPKGETPATVELRRAALIGYIYSPFRMNDLMHGILGEKELIDTRLQIFDAQIADSNLMYDSLESGEKDYQASFSSLHTLEFDGRNWHLRFSSLPAFEATIDLQKPRWVLISGLLGSGLFTAVIWALSLNRRRARELTATNDELKMEIAERRKLTRQLQQAKNDAEAANLAKSEFLANVSHELRTPLTLILSPLEQLLAQAETSPQWRNPLERVQRNALLLLNRVSEILDFAKAEAGKFDVDWQAVDLPARLSPLIEDAAEVARRKGCRLSYRFAESLKTVWLDPDLFEKIAMNLLGNALKFTPEDGEILLEIRLLNDDRFEFAVFNSGPGIRREYQARLFQRFQQGDASSTRRHGGTGIGLALVKELTELMGGRVGVESEPDQGVRFFIQLPCGSARLNNLAAPTITESPLPQTGQIGVLRRARFLESAPQQLTTLREPVAGNGVPVVLVVDDTPDMRAYISELLTADYQVLAAADGEQAWQLLQGRHIDIVVSDVMMPKLDGLGLTQRIKSSSSLSHLPVILVTARGGSEASVSGLESGADDYIAKPFCADELRARVRSALRMARIQAQLRDKSREAGMAILAAGILHNLGNALNGITVTSSLLRDKLCRSKIPRLQQVSELLRQHEGSLAEFLSRDPQGKLLPDYLQQLSEHLAAERIELLRDVDSLHAHTEHATGVVTAHQQFASQQGLQEVVSANDIMEMALTLALAGTGTDGIRIERDYQYNGALAMDRHKVLQILINLLLNAAQSLRAAARTDGCVTVSTSCEQGLINFEVSDNGVGVDSANLPKLFCQGFTTKGNGHGFGLHLSATWALEMGGSLNCHSDGPGQGATFRLELPTNLQCQTCSTRTECNNSVHVDGVI
ncbi:CHASE domain-containing protein [Marinobacterium arenosum]|uniref:CHASE domain-containing protein n=1 Tax=Marinobacterium arenosum TaxID=2862496 RepID=UPI001C94D83F|nr:CHASE domain-containing protein [Marinobacterium arenosum]MBY4675849.1 CHASE domain-containing protein [Marinobacterium arenosum]